MIRIFYRVYNKRDYGFLEKVYENAMMKELNLALNGKLNVRHLII
ncbi:MAG: GxxExxY protein [Euryarchaeota archaeon]|nr:GxxExxY protein [Euryarchaeota archaeon]